MHELVVHSAIQSPIPVSIHAVFPLNYLRRNEIDYKLAPRFRSIFFLPFSFVHK